MYWYSLKQIIKKEIIVYINDIFIEAFKQQQYYAVKKNI